MLDASISPKNVDTDQVIRFYSSPLVKTVFIVRPTMTYLDKWKSEYNGIAVPGNAAARE